MKSCQVLGDLSSDRASEQYPTVAVCDACASTHEGAEESPIVMTGSYDPVDGDECHFCGKSAEEEREEQAGASDK